MAKKIEGSDEAVKTQVAPLPQKKGPTNIYVCGLKAILVPGRPGQCVLPGEKVKEEVYGEKSFAVLIEKKRVMTPVEYSKAILD